MIDWDRLVVGPSTKIFGKPVTYYVAGGPTLQVTGVFDREYLETSPLGSSDGYQPLPAGGMAATLTYRPILGVQLSEFAVQPARGDSLLVAGQHYFVGAVEPDSHGGAKLILNSQDSLAEQEI